MKKTILICFAIALLSFSLTACIIINRDADGSTSVTTALEETTPSAASEETTQQSGTTAAGSDVTSAENSTQKPGITTTKSSTTAPTTQKPGVVTTKPPLVTTTKPPVATTTKPSTSGTCKNWPVNNVTKLVPKPTFGEVISSDLDNKEAHVVIKYDSHPANFKTYVAALKSAGYTNIQEDYSTSFKASNNSGVTVQFYPSKFPPLIGTTNVYVLEINAG